MGDNTNTTGAHEADRALVRKLLARVQSYRDDDKKLILAVGRHYGLHLTKEQRRAFMAMPAFESITRARRHLRKDFPDSPAVQEKRYGHFVGMKDLYGGNKGVARRVVAKIDSDPDMPGYEELDDPNFSINRPSVINRLKGVINGRNKRRGAQSVSNPTEKSGGGSNGRTSQQSRQGGTGEKPRTSQVSQPRTGKASPSAKA